MVAIRKARDKRYDIEGDQAGRLPPFDEVDLDLGVRWAEG